MHALLAHLESAGFEGAPRFLGIDSSGREVLSYINGEVAGRPRPAWIADETRLASVGRLVRAYDDAAASFTAGPDVPPGAPSTCPGGLVSSPTPRPVRHRPGARHRGRPAVDPPGLVHDETPGGHLGRRLAADVR